MSITPHCQSTQRESADPCISLPADLASARPATLCLVDADYPQVLALCETLWAGASRDGWVAYQELPCLLDTAAVDTYAGKVQYGVMGPSATRAGQTRLWTTQADGASSMLTKFAIRLRCRVISTAFCTDWSDANAVAALNVMDGRSTFVERVVRVMRNDNGRLEFFECGDPQEFEQTQNYSKRLLRDRVGEDVLLSYWRELGVDVGAELSEWAGRAGVAYVMANSTPLNAGAALRAA